jgi:hypothetical protein
MKTIIALALQLSAAAKPSRAAGGAGDAAMFAGFGAKAIVAICARIA